MKEYKYIGKKFIRDDAYLKATGRMQYFGDKTVEGMLYGKILWAEYAHAKIIHINTAKAESYKDVVTVLTYKDVPGQNGFGVGADDQQVFCKDKVRFIGDIVAVVVAKTEKTAKEALSLIHVEYEPLETITTAERAMEEDSEKVHESGNVLTVFEYKNGDVDAAFNGDNVVVEHTYTTPYQEHAYLETEVGIGAPMKDGGVEIWCPAQDEFRDREQLSKVLHLPPEKIRLHASPLGGAFGGKVDMSVQPLLGVGVLKTGQPIKISVSREESFRFSVKRLPFKIKMKSAASYDGRLVAHKVETTCDIGPFTGISAGVFYFAVENVFGAYYFPIVDVKGYCVFTNNARTGAFRGFGNNQVTFALETQMDELAEKLSMDPLEFRKRNIVETGKPLCYGHSHAGADGLKESLEILEASCLWKNRDEFKKSAKHPWLKRGVGIASSQHGNGLGKALVDEGSARIELKEDGHFIVYVSTDEMGQGTLTSLHIMAAEALHVHSDHVTVSNSDTDLVADSGATTASKGNYIGGNALLLAIESLKQQIYKYLESQGKDFTVHNNVILLNGMLVSWKEIADEVPKEVRSCVRKFVVPMTKTDVDMGLHFLHSHTSQIVGVEVNTLTGQVNVLETEIIPSAGKVINSLTYEGQSEGGVVMSLGYALMEEYKIGRDTKPLTKNYQTYLVPTVKDIPEIKVTPVETEEGTGPFGAKGLGEPVSIPGTPAIMNAIYDAVGVRIYDLPAKPEKILGFINQQ